MPAAYLNWLDDLLEEAQVELTPETSDYVDSALRRIAGVPTGSDKELMAVLRDRWLRRGPQGRQLLAGLLRQEVYSRRDSPLRPVEGDGYFTNDS